MNNLMVNENNEIGEMIFVVRGKQVMLSSDVAKLYKSETKVINQTIKRNIKRFPESFCFQLTEKEIDKDVLRSRTVTLNSKDNKRGVHYKYMPYVLTEQRIFHIGL